MGLGGLFGLIGKALFGGGSKKDPYADLNAQLNHLINQAKEISGTAGKAGLANTGAASKDYDYLTNYFKNILEGSDDDLLKLLDASGVIAASDENQLQLSELGVRGGRRAANLGQIGFNNSSDLNKILQQLRASTPAQLAQIIQAKGNLGLGELSASTGAGAQASNTIFGVEQLKDADADRRAAMIGSIFQAIGGAAGIIACVSIHGSHFYVPSGKIAAAFIKEGDEVCSFDKETGEPVNRRVIRIRTTKNQITRIISNGHIIIRPTLTHQFYDINFIKLLCGNLDNGDLLTMYNGNKELKEKRINILGEEKNDVMIVKLDDEKECYPMIVNGFVCEDDDPIN